MSNAIKTVKPQKDVFKKKANTIRNVMKFKKKHEAAIFLDPDNGEIVHSPFSQFLKEARKVKDILLATVLILLLFWFQVQAELNSLKTVSYYFLIWISVITTNYLRRFSGHHSEKGETRTAEKILQNVQKKQLNPVIKSKRPTSMS